MICLPDYTHDFDQAREMRLNFTRPTGEFSIKYVENSSISLVQIILIHMLDHLSCLHGYSPTALNSANTLCGKDPSLGDIEHDRVIP